MKTKVIPAVITLKLVSAIIVEDTATCEGCYYMQPGVGGCPSDCEGGRWILEDLTEKD